MIIINMIERGLANGTDVVIVLLNIFAFLFAITLAIVLHELGHGYAAKWNGDMTAKYEGRLSFNPVVHFDPVGFLMMLFVGFGFAKPVPVNPYNFKKPKRGLIMVSLAGVVVNFVLAVLSMFFFVLLVFVLDNTEIFYSDIGSYFFEFFITFFQYMILININLMLFNLLPLGVLDGLKVLEAFTSRGNRLTTFLRNYGMYILYGLIGLHILLNYVTPYVPALIYLDILGQYLYYGNSLIAGGITTLFTHMFGMGNFGWEFFGW